jgi:hypothetical protein
VSNIGGAPLSITSAGLTGADAGNYRIASDGCSGHVVAPAGTCAIGLAFKPTSAGAHNAANLVIASDDPSSPASIALQGSGVEPTVSVKPRKGKFGSVAVAGGSKTKKFKITNTGTSALTVSKLKLKGAKGNYRLKAKSCKGTSIATGATCTFKVVFDPKQAGALGAKLTITTDGGTVTVKLKGNGVS